MSQHLLKNTSNYFFPKKEKKLYYQESNRNIVFSISLNIYDQIRNSQGDDSYISLNLPACSPKNN